MRRVHFCAGLEESNGMAVVARFLAKEQDAQLLDVRDADYRKIRDVDEVWVHSCWTPEVWRACRIASKEGKSLVRMMHGNLDPVRLGYHGWKKHLVGFIERFFLRQADRLVATCESEKEWIISYLGKRCPSVEIIDIKRFFDLNRVERVANRDSFSTEAQRRRGAELHLLYLGRRHPLKGLEYLEEAVRQIQRRNYSASPRLCVRIVFNAFGEEKEKVWDWCDVLVLPTLSENFGLVVAEALERGKRVITTDGAPVWGEGLESRIESFKSGEIWSGYGGWLIYLKGYRDGTREGRIELLKRAMESLVR